MRKVKKIRIFVFITVFIGFFYGSAFAGKEYYTCNVDQVGVHGSTQTRVMLTDEGGAFTQKWFFFKDTRKKEMLATTLAAINCNTQVKIYTDISDGSVPEIIRLFIIAP